MDEPTNSTITTTTRRLDHLQDHLLLHILTFLPTQEAIKTSLISRKFRHTWSSLPKLSLSHHNFSLPNQPLASTRHSFIQLVNHSLFHCPLSSPLRKLCLQFHQDAAHAGPLTTWICYAINSHVTELDLDLSNGSSSSYIDGDNEVPSYDFPFGLLRGSAVTDLKLRYSHVSQNFRLYGIKFVSLKSLFFGYVGLTDEMISDLMHGCVNLESLTLDFCFGMRNIKICSSKIKDLSLKSFHSNTDDTSTSLEIAASSLNVLNIVDFEVDKYIFKGIMSLVEADIKLPHYYYSKVIKLVSHVKRLHVPNYWFKLLETKDFFPKSTILYNLRHLHMLTGYSKSDLFGLAAFLELTPNLDTMILVRQLKFDGNCDIISDEVIDEQINFKLPSLRQVTIKYYGEPENEFHLMELLKQHGVVLEKVELIPAALEKPSSSQ